MYEIDSYGSQAGQWSNGNPSDSTPATVMDAPWFNAVQTELKTVVEAAGLTLDKFDSTQLLQALNLLIGGVPGALPRGDNFFINGDFRVAQRRKTANFSVAGGELAGFVMDRWLSAADVGAGTGAATVSRQAFALGQTAVPGDPVFFLRHQQTANATAGAPTLVQKVESVRGFQSIEVTVSGFIKGSIALSVTAKATQNFGTGGSPSAPVVAGTSVLAVTTSWTPFSATFTLPSIAGKTLGLGNNDHLAMEFAMPLGATYTVEYSRLQVEAGANVSAFQTTTLAQDLARARRFYEKSYEAETDPATLTDLGARHWNMNGVNSISPEAEERFAIDKRALPAITWFNPVNGLSGQMRVGGANLTIPGTISISKRTTGYPNTASGATSLASVHWTADAEI
jgi:hypothetical protein